MSMILGEALDYLTAQSFASLLALFWFVAVFEIPRYVLAFAVTVFVPRPARPPWIGPEPRVSVVIAGHSEAAAVARCANALAEQSRRPDEIIVVSDGSTDDMAGTIRDLLRRGLIDGAHATGLRAGKSAATNLAECVSTGDVIINIDCDCSFDRHAMRNIVRPFAEPGIAAVCGNIAVRNAGTSLVTAFQSIEYLVTISLGKQAGERLGQVTCVSGAFGAFRRDAYRAAGGLDAGGGEDLDLTLRIRRQGGRIAFAEDALCYTDVPATAGSLIRQRFRWERDAVRLRFRKHAVLLNPFSQDFRWSELVHETEFLLFNVIAAVALPFYVIWLWVTYGSYAASILLAGQIGVGLLDLMTVLLSLHVTPGRHPGLLVYVPGYSLYNGLFMRFIRLAAYVQEWVFYASYRDQYVPDKVHVQRG